MMSKTMDSKKFGYIRISSKDQNEVGQLEKSLKKHMLGGNQKIAVVKAMQEIGVKKTPFYKLVREYEELL